MMEKELFDTFIEKFFCTPQDNNSYCLLRILEILERIEKVLKEQGDEYE